jgi:hypothetical protein
MSESRTRAATNGEESHQRKATRFSIPSAEAIHVRGRFSAVFFPGTENPHVLSASTVFSLSNERCSRASTVSPARVIDRLEAHARRAVRAFFFSVIT